MFSALRYQSPFFPVVGLFLIVTLGTPDLNAEEQPMKGKPALPGGDCQVAALVNWFPQEKWVWKQVCQGKIADFNQHQDYGGKLNPTKPNLRWNNRELTSEFLETILLHEPYRSALTRHGVQIVGAYFKDSLDLSNAKLAHQLRMDHSRFQSFVDLSFLKAGELISFRGSKFFKTIKLEGLQVRHLLVDRGAEFAELILRGAKIDGQLALAGSKFNRRNKLDMDGLQVGKGLFMDGGAEFGDVVLRGARINDLLRMSGSKFSGTLDMDGIQVDGTLDMDGIQVGRDLRMGISEEGTDSPTEFSDVTLTGARVDGNVSMVGSEFYGKLILNGLEVGRSLYMHSESVFSAKADLTGARISGDLVMAGSKFGKLEMVALEVGGSLYAGAAEFSDIDLRSATIGGQVNMDKSNFTGKLKFNMDSLQVGTHLLIRNARIQNPIKIKLTFAEIGGGLDLSGSFLPTLSLEGTHIHKVFRLARPPGHDSSTTWHKNSKLTIRNVSTHILEFWEDSFPDYLELELTGFTYNSLEGLTSQGKDLLDTRGVDWYKGWLAKQKRYSPQPYEQLAKVLTKEGHPDKTADVLYAGRNRELSETTGLLGWLRLALLKVFIGYGYRIYYAIFWFLGFITLGALVLRLSGQGPAHGMPYGLAYSLDTLLPIIRLRGRHYDLDLTGWARYYFYLHALMGYVLASFLVAGLSGLTK